jgi:hypothetical protein
LDGVEGVHGKVLEWPLSRPPRSRRAVLTGWVDLRLPLPSREAVSLGGSRAWIAAHLPAPGTGCCLRTTQPALA